MRPRKVGKSLTSSRDLTSAARRSAVPRGGAPWQAKSVSRRMGMDGRVVVGLDEVLLL